MGFRGRPPVGDDLVPKLKEIFLQNNTFLSVTNIREIMEKDLGFRRGEPAETP